MQIEEANSLRQRLAQRCLQSLDLAVGLTPRERTLIQQTVGSGGTAEGYLYGGLTTATGLRAVLDHIGRPLEAFRDVLDFGCGSARVCRWFNDILPDTSVSGVDINPEAIDWAQRNVSGATFLHVKPKPPLPFPDKHFDLIVGVSVLTHLDECFQFQWLRELNRVLRDDGLVLLSVHGENKARMHLPAPSFDRLEQTGFLYEQASDSATVEGLPSFYQVAYHTKSYIEKTWSRFFRVGLQVEHGPLYTQNLLVLQPAGRGGSDSLTGRLVSLPIACVDAPVFGAVVEEHSLHLTGWAFRPDGIDTEVEVFVDGRILDRFIPHLLRADVAAVFDPEGAARGAKMARNSGFDVRISLAKLKPGNHVLWISDASSPFPVATTFFRKAPALEKQRPPWMTSSLA